MELTMIEFICIFLGVALCCFSTYNRKKMNELIEEIKKEIKKETIDKQEKDVDSHKSSGTSSTDIRG